MSKNQSVSSIIFGEVVDQTSSKSHAFKEYQSRKQKTSIATFWKKLMVVLEIQPLTELEALRILWKLSRQDICITKSLLPKLSAVCLLIAEKLTEDQAHSIQSISLVSSIPIKQLVALQIQTLSMLDYRLVQNSEEMRELPKELTTKIYQNCI